MVNSKPEKPGENRTGITSDRKKREEFQPEEKKAVKKAMNLLLYRNRSEKELHDRLVQEGYSEEAVRTAEEYVRSFGYLNDRRYAENYVASYYGKKSRMALSCDLRARGVDEKWIEEALEEIPEEETGIMMKLLEKKAGEPHCMDEKEYRRCGGFLARRGYRSGDIRKVLREYQDRAEEDTGYQDQM